MTDKLDFPLYAAPFDLIVIGGGINGAGIASEAASRGLNVGLYEAKDFAIATSSASSKLLHGGLRYLEQYEFRLVKEALAEREILLKKAAHIVRPMRFRLPHHASLRPAWLIRLGLFLYDHLARRSVLPPSRSIKLEPHDGLNAGFINAFEYSDCWVDDSRLVIANVKHAHSEGAEVRNYCRVLNVSRNQELWDVELYDQRTKQTMHRSCRAIVNATGPWAADFLNQFSPDKSLHTMRLVKGSHLIVPRLYDGESAYLLQNDDKRVVFVIPYLDKFSMIGTTDIPFTGDPYLAQASDDEINYLLTITNQHFRHQLTARNVVSSFSGVRPLFGDESSPAQELSRDYELVIQTDHGKLPILTVYGGKLTTYRKLAAKAVDKLSEFFPNSMSSQSSLSVFAEAKGFDYRSLFKQVSSQYPELAKPTIERLIELYGVELWEILSVIGTDTCPIAGDVYQAEIDHLVSNEWALTLDDILNRRTKLGYFLNNEEREALLSVVDHDLSFKIEQQ